MYDIAPASWRTQAWRNGGGITHELLRQPDRDDYALRLSIAEVTRSGPFSQFGGYRRWTMLVEGGPLELAGARLATVGDLVELDGEQHVTAAITGTAKLLNVLARNDTARMVGFGATPRALAVAIAICDGAVMPLWNLRVFDSPTVFDARCCAWVT
ncbi:MAG: HutD family protein [Kofleriaceae bacterium]